MTTPTTIKEEEGRRFWDRVMANCAIIFPGAGRSFEFYPETDDYIHYWCELFELVGAHGGGQRLEIRCMTESHYCTQEKAMNALDRQLENAAREILLEEGRKEVAKKEAHKV